MVIQVSINSLEKAALAYAVKGWATFSCKPLGKSPLTEHGYREATINESAIRKDLAEAMEKKDES